MGFIPRVNLSVLCDPILMAIAQTLLLAQYFFLRLLSQTQTPNHFISIHHVTMTSMTFKIILLAKCLLLFHMFASVQCSSFYFAAQRKI